MYKYLIGFLFFTIPIFSQPKLNSVQVDSVTYNYYLIGNWNELIALGKIAIKEGVDFKYLQQRMGYAYFVKGNYFEAIRHYQHALNFDDKDEVSHTYLYYSANSIGDTEMAMYHASKLSSESRMFLKLKSFRPLDAIDFEYNYKINGAVSDPTLTISDLRSNPNYTRIGINSKPDFRFNIYQSFSQYNQTNNSTSIVKQNEYFLLLTYNLFNQTALRFGYHYLNTKVDDAVNKYKDTIKINVFYGNLSQRIGRFDFGLSSSIFTSDTLQTQIGVHVGLLLPTKFKPYLKSTLYSINRNGISRMVYTQSVGILPTNKLWIEGKVSFGNLNNFIDNNGLYVYNSIDHTIFRSGFSAFWSLLPKLTVYTNYTFDKKLNNEPIYNYKQHSITGGIIWKI